MSDPAQQSVAALVSDAKIEFGRVARGERVSAEWNIEVDPDAEWIVLDEVEVSCGCSTGTLLVHGRTLEKGDIVRGGTRILLQGVYDTSTKRVGRDQFSYLISWYDSKKMEGSILLSGACEIYEWCKITPSVTSFGSVEPNKVTSRKVSLSSDTNFQLCSWSSTTPDLRISYSGADLQLPLTFKADATIDVVLQPSGAAGLAMGVITLNTADDRKVRIKATWNCVSHLDLTPANTVILKPTGGSLHGEVVIKCIRGHQPIFKQVDPHYSHPVQVQAESSSKELRLRIWANADLLLSQKDRLLPVTISCCDEEVQLPIKLFLTRSPQ